MTATLDLLERRGWIRRVPNPDDRRSVLIEITPDGRAITDQLLPGIRALERQRPVRPHPGRTGVPAGAAGQDPRPGRRGRRRAAAAQRPAHPPGRPAPPHDTEPGPPPGPRYCHGRIPAPQLNNTPKSQPGSPGTRHRLSRLPGVTGPRSWRPLRFWPRRSATTPATIERHAVDSATAYSRYVAAVRGGLTAATTCWQLINGLEGPRA